MCSDRERFFLACGCCAAIACLVLVCVSASASSLSQTTFERSEVELVCVSLAALQLHSSANEPLPLTARECGFMTRPRAIVLDTMAGDVILVGERDSRYPTVRLDDFVVALRHVYLDTVGTPPGVSIEPIIKGKSVTGHRVVYFAGIDGTHFGKVCFEADYLLKQIGLGLRPSGSPHVSSYWEEGIRSIEKPEKQQRRLSARSYFSSLAFPLSGCSTAVVLQGDAMEVVAAPLITTGNERLRIALHKRYGAFEKVHQTFARDFTEHYDEAARTHPILDDLRNLMCLLQLCAGLRALPENPRLGYWLANYEVEPCVTPTHVAVHGRGTSGFLYTYGIAGGVSLDVDPFWVRSYEPSSLAIAVLDARPSAESPCWVLRVSDTGLSAYGKSETFPVEEYIAQGRFLLAQHRLNDAVGLLTKAATEIPSAELFSLQAIAYSRVGEPDTARTLAQAALDIDSESALAWTAKGCVEASDGRDRVAMTCLARASELDPAEEMCMLEKARILIRQGRHHAGVAICNGVLALDSGLGEAWLLVGDANEALGDFPLARDSWLTAIHNASSQSVREAAVGRLHSLSRHDPKIVDSNIVTGLLSPSQIPQRSGGQVELSIDAGITIDQSYPSSDGIVTTGYQGSGYLGLTWRLGLVVRNRTKVSLTLPLEGRAFVFPTSVDPHTNFAYQLGISGWGISVSHILSDGVFKRPMLAVESRLVGPSAVAVSEASPIFELPVDTSAAQSGAWYALLGAAGDCPLWDWRVRLTASVTSLLPISSPDAQRTTIASVGLLNRVTDESLLQEVGFRLERRWTDLPWDTSYRDSRLLFVFGYGDYRIQVGYGRLSGSGKPEDHFVAQLSCAIWSVRGQANGMSL